MKIAFIYDAVYPWVKGGAEKRVYKIAKILADRGHEVHWYCVGWWAGNGEKNISIDGINFHGVCGPLNLYLDGKRAIKPAIYFAIKLLPHLLKEKYDIIDCQEFPYFPCFSAKINSLFKGSTMLITWYEVWDKYWFEYLGKKGLFGFTIERLTLKLPKKLLPISGKIKEDLIHLKVNENKLKVIPNGVDYYKMQKINPSNKKYDIIYVGRLISHKNVDVLLKSIALVKEKKMDVKCGIIGDGPEINRLKSLNKELGLESNIKFFGFIEKDEDVYSLMKSSKIFVLPSTREGFPNTILEANACGLPAIVIDHEKNAGVGVVKNRYNGFVLNLSSEEIADKIIYLLKNEDELNKMSKYSLDFAKKHDWKLIVDKIEEIYRQALS